MIGDSSWSLPADEGDPDHHARDDREDRHRRDPILRDLLEPEDHGEDGEERHRDAEQVQPAGIRVLVLGQGARSDDEEESHDRDADQEHRAPPEELQEHAAEDRPDRTACGIGGDPETDRGRALLRVQEHGEDQRERRGGDGCSGDAHDGPARDEHLGARREGREQRRQREPRGAAKEELAPADAVAERAHRDEEARDQETVDVDDPEQLCACRSQLGTDPRDGEVEHRQVHRIDERGQRQHSEADPFATGGPRGYHVLARSLTHAPRSLPGTQYPSAQFVQDYRISDCRRPYFSSVVAVEARPGSVPRNVRLSPRH